MNFQELMSKANANNTTKQLRKSGHHHKDSTPGISSSAVQAFLAKKQQEQKKKQAEVEAARLARIQARLDQDLKSNQAKKAKRQKESVPKSSSLNPPYVQEEETTSKPPKIRKREDHLTRQKTEQRSKSELPIKTSSSRAKDLKGKSKANNVQVKTIEKVSEHKLKRNHQPVLNGKKNDTAKSKKKSRAAPPPPNFKELLAIAEQNKSGLKRVKSKTELSANKKKDIDIRVDESKIRRRKEGSGENKRKLTEMEGKNNRIKDKSRGITEVKTKGKQAEPQRKTAAEPERNKAPQSKSRAPEGPTKLKRTKDPGTNTRDVLSSRPQRPGPYNGRPFEPPRRMYQQIDRYTSSRPSYLDDYYDEEDSDLEGFIDDGADEDCGGETDVSRHIRDIFGYDRRRFAGLNELDDSAMESSYGQIEREEKRSSKIAKLEDEIDILKEQAELKRLRDKLKNSNQSKKK